MGNPNRFGAAVLSFFIGIAAPQFASAHHSYSLDTIPQLQERILVMRHAEKPESSHDPNLTPAGFRRAQELPSFIESRYGRPDFIFAAANSKKSMRPMETAMPLSVASGVPVIASFKDKDFKELANMLQNDGRFIGKTVVVIWHHGNIPDLARCLNARSGSYPNEWPSSSYNQILELDYVGKKHPNVALVQEPF